MKYVHHIDLNKNELQNAVLQNLASDPGTPLDGQLYFNTADDRPKIDTSAGWRYLIHPDDDFHVNLSTTTGTEDTDELMIWDNGTSSYKRQTRSEFLGGGGVGETNTGANVGSLGYGPYDGKTNAVLNFRNIASLDTSTLAVSLDDTANNIGLTIVESGIDHNVLANYDVGQHRIINDGGTSATELWSASKIDGLFDSHTHVAADVTDLATVVKAYRLDEFAVPTSSVAFNDQKITGLGTPTLDADAATKLYVDNVSAGLDYKDSVRAATTDSNITLSGTQTIDGVSVIADDRVLVKNQTAGEDNGIYVVSATAWSRSADADTSEDVTSGMYMFVEEGTDNGTTSWILSTPDPIVLGTTSLTFVKYSGAGQIIAGDALTKTGETLDVNPYVGSTVNRGQTVIESDSLAVILGTGANTAALGNHTHAIDDLSDVTETSVLDDELLVYDTNVWVNKTIAEAGLEPTITGGASTITGSTDLTVNRALISSAAGKVAVSVTTATELSYVNGVTSAIQTQFDAKPGKHSESVGNGALTSIVVTHSLNTRDVSVVVIETGTPYEMVIPDIEMTTVDTVTVKFSVAPTTNQYRVTVQG